TYRAPQSQASVRRCSSPVALAPPPAPASSAAAAKTVKIDASAAPWVVAGGHVGIKGTVTPHPAGVQVALQQRHGDGWLTVGDEPVRANGSFSFTTTPTQPGAVTYRVVTVKGTSYVGSSARVRVRVLHWSYVSAIDAFAYL